jgi:hypothetical protein
MDHLRRLGNRISAPIKRDKHLGCLKVAHVFRDQFVPLPYSDLCLGG